jgi:hypothetical protein
VLVPFDNIVTSVCVMFGIGLVLLLLLWPSARNGRRLLVRWQVAEPTDAEIADAVRYLKRRRIWYPWLFLGASALVETIRSATIRSGTVPDQHTDTTWPALLSTLVLGALVAELVAQRSPRSTRRAAGLTPRSLRGTLGFWPSASFAVLFVLVAGSAGLALGGVGWAARMLSRPGWALAGVVAVTAVALLVAWLAVRRPDGEQPRADDALRRRSARVAVGLAMAVFGTIAAGGGTTAGLFLGLAGLVCWIATVSPARQVVTAPV